MMQLRSALLHTITVLQPHPQARPFAEILISQLLGVSRSYLYTHEEELLTPSQNQEWQNAITALQKGTPYAYVLGHCEFFGLDLSVTPDVLIPRQDTEVLVTQVLNLFSADDVLQVLELGTGSGAIALALAQQRSNWIITATDISPAALQIAQHNAQNLNIHSVSFLQSDWFTQLPAHSKFDVIISNPPYIAKEDPELEWNVRHFEPPLALFADHQGLAALKNIIQLAPKYLKSQGALLLEHGHTQSKMVQQLLKENNFTRVTSIQDQNRKERVSLGWRG